MPYYIAKEVTGCKGNWAVISDAGTLHGCHGRKKDAIDQAVAISISTKEKFMGEKTNRAMPEDLSVGDYVAWVVQTTELEIYAGVITELLDTEAKISVWDEEEDVWSDSKLIAITAIADLIKIEPLPTEPPADAMPDAMDAQTQPMQDMQMNSRDKWIRAAWLVKTKLEGGSEEARSFGTKESRTEHVELRATGDGMTFEGYAAVFNSDSHPLPFIERIQPGAFKRSLQGRHRMMLLWNHDSSQPLASTRNGSLKLTEDTRGLKVTAKLANTQLGRDVAELIRSGTIDAMSFGFQVKKDSWSMDGQVRTLEEIALSEVSLVSYPAYEGTSGSTTVREKREISADKLAEGMFKLESGEELDSEESAVLLEVINKLSKTEEVQEVDGDIMALKQKKLTLLMKEAI